MNTCLEIGGLQNLLCGFLVIPAAWSRDGNVGLLTGHFVQTFIIPRGLFLMILVSRICHNSLLVFDFSWDLLTIR